MGKPFDDAWAILKSLGDRPELSSHVRAALAVPLPPKHPFFDVQNDTRGVVERAPRPEEGPFTSTGRTARTQYDVGSVFDLDESGTIFNELMRRNAALTADEARTMGEDYERAPYDYHVSRAPWNFPSYGSTDKYPDRHTVYRQLFPELRPRIMDKIRDEDPDRYYDELVPLGRKMGESFFHRDDATDEYLGTGPSDPEFLFQQSLRAGKDMSPRESLLAEIRRRYPEYF
tara:strand:- start:545 stop:1234 length:690 start_codon:yes stop_codon:yes gene_type:complete